MTDVTIRSLYSNERVITKAHVRGDRLYVTLNGMRAALRRLQARDGSREARPDYVHGFSHWHQLPSGAWCCNRQ